ncbi:type IV secretion protein Rhs (plasmid) [Methylomonas koyamae]|nr:type IV secretion protein Rhs [Methylomonas koyamae]
MRRFYNSQSNVKTTLGFGWRGSWQQALTIDSANTTVKATREDGRVESFTKSATGDWQSDADVVNQLSVIKDAANQQTGWQLLTRDDAIESYTLDGRLSAITTRAGMTTSLSYDNQNRLSKVTGHFGYALSFAYNSSNQLASISLPDGSRYQYAYDANNNLISVTNPDQTKRQYVYENSTFTHLLTGIIDEKGKRFATWTYDAKGRATSSQHAGGAELTSVAYNADGSSTVTDALGNQHGYNFTTQFDVVKPTNVTGAANKGLGAKAFTYDANGFVASKTDFNGNVTTFVRDAGGQETSRTEAAGTPLARTITTTWHANYRLPIKITEPNRVTSFSYDANGNLLKRTVTAGNDSRSWTFTYNAAGQVLTVDGPRTDVNDISQFAYDNLGNLSSVTDALGHVMQFTAYNANGQLLSSKDANGLVKTLTYDARGRVTSIKAGDETTAYVYDAVGQVIKTIAPDGTAIVFSYDDAHRLVKVTDQLGNHLDYTLDAMGNKLKEQIYDPNNNLAQTLSQQFDNLNRLVATLDAAGKKQVYAYDSNDNPLTVTDPLGNVTSLSYDALNRMIGSVDPDGNHLTTAYDANDNLVSVTDPLTHATQYSYDGLGNALTIDTPDTGVSTNKYDSAGNKIESTDARGEKVGYSYDALNRVKQIQYGNSQIVSFTYDQGTHGIGHLTQMNDAAGVTRWSYNQHGRISSKTFTSGSLTLVTRYNYDANGRLSSIVYPSGNLVQVSYQNGLVTAMDSNGKSLLSSIAYQPFGAPTVWNFGNGAKTTREFDLDGRLVAYDLGERNRQLIYDDEGRISGYQDSNMNYDQSFAYDALSRLLADSTPSSQIDYSYDANGNRTGKLSGTVTDTSTIDAASNRLLKNSNPAKDYSYDAAGNLINDGIHQFTYDARGRLVKASSLLGTEHYLLNGLGQRLAKLKSSPVDMAGDANQDGVLTAVDLRLIVLMTQGSAPVNLAADCNHDSKITSADAVCTQSKMADMRINPNKYAPLGTYFVYDEAGHLIGEYNQKGTPIQETVWLGDMPVAVMAGGSNYYVYADHLNTPKAIADEAGKTIWRWDSEAFGSTLANEDPDKDGKAFVYNLRFPGQYYDQLTGLHYNGFRDYDPKIGRYIESDPIGLNGGLNTYGYVEGNPISKVDVKGLDVIVFSDSFHEVVGIETLNGLAIRSYGPSLAGGSVIHGFKAEEYVEVRRVPYSLQDGQRMLESLQSEDVPLYTGLINCQTYAHSIANKAQYGARMFGIPYFGFWTPLPVDVPGMIQAVPRTFELGWREFKEIIKK